MLGAVEMLCNGVTAVHDDAFYNPWPTRPAIDAVMSAYRDSGLRATVAINHQNRPELDKLPFLAEILPPDIRAEVDAIRIAPLDELTGLYHWFHETWHGAADGRLRMAVSNSAPQRVTEDYFAFLSEFSRRHDLPFNIHILETKTQRVLGIERFGKSLVRLVHDLGFLDERMLVIHAIWVDEADMDLSPPRDARWRTTRSAICAWAAASCRSVHCATAASLLPSAPTNARLMMP